MAGMDRKQRQQEIEAGAARAAAEDTRAQERHNLDMQLGMVNLQRLKTQLARADSAQLGPGVPQGAVDRVPSRLVVGNEFNAAEQPGGITSFQYQRNDDGSIGIVPSEQARERSEDSLIEESLWNMRNRIGPWMGGVTPPSTRDYPLPRNHVWRWDPARQAFVPYNTVVPSRRGDARNEISPQRPRRPSRRSRPSRPFY